MDDEGFTADGFTTDGFQAEDPVLLMQPISFLYNSSKKGISFANEQLENKIKNVNVTLR